MAEDMLTVYGGTPGVYSVPVAVAADAAGKVAAEAAPVTVQSQSK
jgi:hypothetical protein